ncbi:MAG: glycosyltransferase family 4 protein [Clostridia bacterium]|nr:glycosyltransferase family 4 protein [Clostridia bacterium]
MKKVLLVATVQSHIAQFHKPLIDLLHDKGCIVHIAAKNNLAEKNGLSLGTVEKVFDVPFSRSPFSSKNIKALKELKRIINQTDYDVIHCNTPVGGILTRWAARKKRKQGRCKVIYEAHGFHFFKGAPKKNWLLWYPIEKHFSRYTDSLIVINKMDFDLASKKFKAKNVARIPGVGVNLKQFHETDGTENFRKVYDLAEDDKIVLSVGELNKNKNHQAIIRAISILDDKKVHYFLAGNGPLRNELEQLSEKLGVKDQIHFLGYRRDLITFYQNADIFVFPSLREGLGMASIEAMSFGLPLITSNRHGINDYSENGISGFKYNPNDYQGFAEGIKKVLYDENLKREMGLHNQAKAQEFTLEASLERINQIYTELWERV